MGYQGGYGRDRYSGDGFPRKDLSKLFGKSPDIVGIKEALKTLSWKDIEPYFNPVVENAKNFKNWEPEEIMANAITVAAYLVVQDLRTNQVRKILEMARNLELKIKKEYKDINEDIMRIRYLLAYTVGKATGQSRHSLEAFYKVLDPMLEALMEEPTKRNFGRFFDFLQAVVAYHRLFGGRE